MPLIMRGTWTVSGQRNAAFPQRFIVSGASSGNGTYVFDGSPDPGPVTVNGTVWSIKVQANPGSGWTDSEWEITVPTVAGGQYQFLIKSNDVWPGDADFNDLVLTCTAPVTISDFLIYGNVSTYSGCIANPCYKNIVVIESAKAFELAKRYPGLADAIEKIDPQRLYQPKAKLPIPLPDPPPFRPIAIPLTGESLIPAKTAQVLKATRMQKIERPATDKTKEPAGEAGLAVQLVRTQAVSAAAAHTALAEIDRSYLGRLLGKARPLCLVDPLANAVLRFLEYDRTPGELAGGAYTGEGDREALGTAATDRNGNYLFRFSRSLAQFFGEGDVDVAAGESEIVQAMPDIIVQVLDATATSGVAYETLPYWNVPLLKRINICFPAGQWGHPSECHGKPITHIGFIPVSKSTVTFDDEGRVTCTDMSKPDIPQARCAAWFSYLRMSACLGKYSSVPHYTVEHRSLTDQSDPTSWTAWQVFEEPLYLDKWNAVTNEWQATKTGPFATALDFNGNGAVSPGETATAYNNIQGNTDWNGSEWFLKAIITSWSPVYRTSPGTVQFRIRGYDPAGLRVPSTLDTITMYFDNTTPEIEIADVKMGSQSGSACALFHLSGEPVPAVLTVKFKAAQRQGFLGSYALGVRKGNIGQVAIQADPGHPGSHALSAAYSHGAADPCNALYGTLLGVDPGADVNDFVTAHIVPAVDPNWLVHNPPSHPEPFCTFAVQLSASMRRTDGHDDAIDAWGPIEYFLGIEI